MHPSPKGVMKILVNNFSIKGKMTRTGSQKTNMELSKESHGNNNSKGHNFQAYNQFTTIDVFRLVKPSAGAKKRVDGDWEKVFDLLKNNGAGHQYFAVTKSDEDGKTLLHHACIRSD